MKMIDAHIHLDRYQDQEIKQIIEESAYIDSLLSVSFHLESCKRNLLLSKMYSKVRPAFGFHPEQPLPNEKEMDDLFAWIGKHSDEMKAVGEVGLPYYLRKENKISPKQYDQYVKLLEDFIYLTKEYQKPIVLHAVYDDAPIVCDLLEKHSITKAHFHWFKGNQKTVLRMIQNGYFISITPDVIYEEEIQELATIYPLEYLMIETDGPWPFEGPFQGRMTHPCMMKDTISMIAKINKLTFHDTAETIYQNTKRFYDL
jgi:TatD DNase family protein